MSLLGAGGHHDRLGVLLGVWAAVAPCALADAAQAAKAIAGGRLDTRLEPGRGPRPGVLATRSTTWPALQHASSATPASPPT